MNYCLKISLNILILLFSVSLFPVDAQAVVNHLVINEVYYDIAKDKGVEGTNEWVEIYNPTNSQINLKKWTICDATASERIINNDYLLGPYSYAVITKDATTWNFWSVPAAAIKIELGYSIGSGLNNDGDKVILRDENDDIIDEISYGKDKDILDLPEVAEGRSFERIPRGGDEFISNSNPTPGIGLPSKIILSLNEVNPDSIELNWTKNQDFDFKSYIVYQSLDNIIWDEIVKINANNILNYKITLLDSGKKYYLKVRIENQIGGFWDSNIVSTITKKVYTSAVLINELFPHPSTGTNDEFIELYNNADVDVDLGGWILRDGRGSTTTFVIPDKVIIQANSYLIFYKKETHLALNDDSDFLSLYSPDDNLISVSLEYKNAESDISWSRDNMGNWFFSTTPTPGESNIFTNREDQNQDLIIISIADAKTKTKNSWVKVSGIVTAIPGLFGKKVMYIQDESGGIKIYFDKALWPELSIGDKVIILGKITQVSGEYEVKIYNTYDIVIASKELPPSPIGKKIGELDNYIGQIIKVSGKISKISGSTIWIDDGTGILRIYFYPATGIKKLGLEKGDSITIIGILSKTSAGLRLLPRSKDDILIFKQNQEKIKTKKESLAQQILGVEKAYASSDYRTQSNPAQIKKKFSFLWGLIVITIAIFSLASLVIFARIHKSKTNF